MCNVYPKQLLYKGQQYFLHIHDPKLYPFEVFNLFICQPKTRFLARGRLSLQFLSSVGAVRESLSVGTEIAKTSFLSSDRFLMVHF